MRKPVSGVKTPPCCTTYGKRTNLAAELAALLAAQLAAQLVAQLAAKRLLS